MPRYKEDKKARSQAVKEAFEELHPGKKTSAAAMRAGSVAASVKTPKPSGGKGSPTNIRTKRPHEHPSYPLTKGVRGEWNLRLTQVKKLGVSDGCSLGSNKDGYYCYTHRTRSKSYPTPIKIPIDKIRFVASTS